MRHKLKMLCMFSLREREKKNGGLSGFPIEFLSESDPDEVGARDQRPYQSRKRDRKPRQALEKYGDTGRGSLTSCPVC